MNIQSKNQLDSPNTFLVIVVTVSKKIVLRKTRLKLKLNKIGFPINEHTLKISFILYTFYTQKHQSNATPRKVGRY